MGLLRIGMSACPSDCGVVGNSTEIILLESPGERDAMPAPPPGSFVAGLPARNADALFEEVYARLKAMAARQRSRGAAAATLETTALVHELYLRMSTGRELVFEHQAQFFAYAARAMRHLLADRARDRLRQRAGGDWIRVTLTGGSEHFALESAEQALALDAALQRLADVDARAAKVLELHYFAGLTIEQIAATLDVARSTIDRDWRFARAFLKDEIGR
jgi:RNA polymerase sigma factor (TIGR02999 family)